MNGTWIKICIKYVTLSDSAAADRADSILIDFNKTLESDSD